MLRAKEKITQLSLLYSGEDSEKFKLMITRYLKYMHSVISKYFHLNENVLILRWILLSMKVSSIAKCLSSLADKLNFYSYIEELPNRTMNQLICFAKINVHLLNKVAEIQLFTSNFCSKKLIIVIFMNCIK